MATAMPVNTAVITPLEAPPNPGAQSSVVMSAAPSWPTYSTQATQLPDITQMHNQLTSTGTLLNEIPIQPITVNTPLEHLQPGVVQLPQIQLTGTIDLASGIEIPANAIKLASTAPGEARTVTQVAEPANPANPTTSATAQSLADQIGESVHSWPKATIATITFLTLVSLGLLVMMMMQNYAATAVPIPAL